MEGGDHHEELPEAIVPPEITEKQTSDVEEKKDESTEALTDSILDDDLVVIPSQTEIQQEESAVATDEQPDSVPSEPSPPSEPEPQAAVPASELLEPTPQTQPAPAPAQPATAQPATAQPAPAQPAPAQSTLTPVPPPQPNPEPSTTTKTRPASATVRSSKLPTKAPLVDDDDDDDFEDETLTERLMGLTEMFPSTLCTVAGVTFNLSVSSMKKLFNFSRSALWIGSTSFMLLILPIVFETEMVHMEQAQIQRQKQILLGPNAATAGGMTGGMTPPMPGISVAAPPSESR
ncbi:proline-rich protein 12-like [Lytechinus variegatus]|uniref:proline-rich protein 12-like n=1 Tax=Lytechinus variegatus TaxID=7654 RepID=UPI001BB21FE1|nr:proline-rich protein 12-like [Lytechinus variegatus]